VTKVHSPKTPWRNDPGVIPKEKKVVSATIYPKASDGPSRWLLLEGKGGNSKYTDKNGKPLPVPTIECWRPLGWPALSLSYVRGCGQPDEEKLAETRRANIRDFDRVAAQEFEIPEYLP
jgi:hypothetical protein